MHERKRTLFVRQPSLTFRRRCNESARLEELSALRSYRSQPVVVNHFALEELVAPTTAHSFRSVSSEIQIRMRFSSILVLIAWTTTLALWAIMILTKEMAF
jgi:hypothetical protein